MIKSKLTSLLLLLLVINCCAQETTGFGDKIANFPNKLFRKIDDQTTKLDKDLTAQTERYLKKLAKMEVKLRRKLEKQDSSKAATFFSDNPEQKYISFIQRMNDQGITNIHSMGPEYLPYADSLQGALSFLNKNSQLLNNSKNLPGEVQQSLNSLQLLQSKLQSTEAIKQYIQQRREQITQYLSGYKQLPSGLSSILGNYNKQVYYFQSQIRQYREMLNDPDKMLKEALTLLNKLPAFQTYMKNNSFLAGLFTMAGNYGTADGIEGLQTRDQVMAIIQSQVGQGGANASSTIQNSLQTAQQDISKLQNKLNTLGGGSGDMDMPNFKPNTQHTKSFFDRLEYGTDLQTQHAAYYFPTTTDIGLSVGYKLNEKSTIGIGGSYKIGWGTGFNHIKMSSQGGSIRSFIDVQAKYSFYLSGGFEYNYQPLPISTTTGLPLPGDAWQKSGLIGLSKIVKLGTKFFRKTKVQLLWDFLSYYQVPKAQPILFRVGYIF